MLWSFQAYVHRITGTILNVCMTSHGYYNPLHTNLGIIIVCCSGSIPIINCKTDRNRFNLCRPSRTSDNERTRLLEWFCCLNNCILKRQNNYYIQQRMRNKKHSCLTKGTTWLDVLDKNNVFYKHEIVVCEIVISKLCLHSCTSKRYLHGMSSFKNVLGANHQNY